MSIESVTYLRLKRTGSEGRELLIVVEVEGKYYRTDLPGEIHEVDIPGEGWEIFDALGSRVRSPYSSQGLVPELVPAPSAQAEMQPLQRGESVQPMGAGDRPFSPIHLAAMGLIGYHGSFFRAMEYVEQRNLQVGGRAALPFVQVMSALSRVRDQISTAGSRATRVERILQGNEGWPHSRLVSLPEGHIQKLMLLWLRAHGFRDDGLQAALFANFQDFKFAALPHLRGRGFEVSDL